MNGWMLGGLAGACFGVCVYLATGKSPEVVPAVAMRTPTPVVAPAKPPAPVVLPNVVEVTNLDPLLDPPEKPVVGVPFETDASDFPAAVPPAPPIPPAAEGPAVAPMPREATTPLFHLPFGLSVGY